MIDVNEIEALGTGRHGDPFRVLGMHSNGSGSWVHTVQPAAESVWFVPDSGAAVPMPRVGDGVFALHVDGPPEAYRLRIRDRWGTHLIHDPYGFPTTIGGLDEHLLGEGRHGDLADIFGAHRRTVNGVAGVRFAVWAPNAKRVSVVGSFNQWDGRHHPMRKHPSSGIWELFIPELLPGELYKYELLDRAGNLLPLKSDPFARRCELRPATSSVVHESRYVWDDAGWMASRDGALDGPMTTYEVHLGSWRRVSGDDDRPLTYRELADELVPYVADMGFTHVELMPITEHPFDGSWGYQPIGMFAPTGRYGSPDDFKALVDRFHQAGVGVILDWVPAHFPRDEHGLARFDGTCLYEHADPRRGEHPEWGTLTFNTGRTEVANYLTASALFWVREYHIDALRVDAVASMLYRDYSRPAGAWTPNEHGGNEDFETVALLQRINTAVHEAGGRTIAEESTAWPAVSRPVEHGGLGFSYKWNMGWMNDTLSYMGRDPVHRRHHHGQLTFGLLYAWNENFILPLSHDEVVHGKGSLLGRMPGDEWQRFANLRAYYGYMYAHPGKKLLFMGSEIAPYNEWSHERSLDWHLLEYPVHAGVQRLVRDLNRLAREVPALHRGDFTPDGFGWASCDDSAASVIAMLRHEPGAGDTLLAVSNFTPVPREGYRVGVPVAGPWREVLNTDAHDYAGSGIGNLGSVAADGPADGGYGQSLKLTLPPLATIYLRPEGAA
jgi:1,4-alpha-glucan branching enzyme